MKPQAGHAVRLTKDMYWGKAGSIGIIDGTVGEDIKHDEPLVIFRCSGQAFRGRNTKFSDGPEYVSCSGGPGYLIAPSALEETGETVNFRFWRWKGLPCAHGGEDYELEVPVWDWTPPEN